MYVIGSPLCEEVSIKVPDGKYFRITAAGVSDKYLYIESATLNGKPLNRSCITHAEVMASGDLKLAMGATPNKA